MIRAYGEVRYAPDAGDPMRQPDVPQGFRGAAFIQAQVAIGAHGAHPY